MSEEAKREYPCTCPKENCPRHGNCYECIKNHRTRGNVPNCYRFPLEGELGINGEMFKAQ